MSVRIGRAAQQKVAADGGDSFPFTAGVSGFSRI